jgi:hypothetical protein
VALLGKLKGLVGLLRVVVVENVVEVLLGLQELLVVEGGVMCVLHVCFLVKQFKILIDYILKVVPLNCKISG